MNLVTDDRVWWWDPSLTPPPEDQWDREVWASYAPMVCIPPHECFAPIACSRLGVCERRKGGLACIPEGL